ncbi:MAG: hypothetical protein IT162_15020 [Bryobacterales bacterium]|nr:hypothetical protein [Bryobacterales bacterium]
MRKQVMSIALCAAAGALSAQEKEVRVEVLRDGGAVASAPAMVGVAPQRATFEFIAAEPGIMGKVVAGAPYSGEGFTEVVRTLADGSRITNKHSKKVWRDGKGRTREEGTLGMIGPWAASGGAAPKFITITDPVAKVIYTLNEADKTAVKRAMPDWEKMHTMARDTKDGKAMVYRSEERHEVVVNSGAAGVAGASAVPDQADVILPRTAVGGGVSVAMMHTTVLDGRDTKEEALGTQTMEGLKVEGKRSTHTMAAGAIGNDRALVTVSERWTSPELQVLVRMTTKDPQAGETSYRLTNISRSEPAASMFQVPADYTVREAQQRIRFETREVK